MIDKYLVFTHLMTFVLGGIFCIGLILFFWLIGRFFPPRPDDDDTALE